MFACFDCEKLIREIYQAIVIHNTVSARAFGAAAAAAASAAAARCMRGPLKTINADLR